MIVGKIQDFKIIKSFLELLKFQFYGIFFRFLSLLLVNLKNLENFKDFTIDYKVKKLVR